MDGDSRGNKVIGYSKRERIHWLDDPTLRMTEAQLTNSTLIKVDKDGNIETDAPPNAKSNGRIIKAKGYSKRDRIHWVKAPTAQPRENHARSAKNKPEDDSGADEDNCASA